MTNREQQFIEMAISLARKGMNTNTGGPFGCVVVKGNEVIGKGCNSVSSLKDPTAHAEIVAIRDACKNLQTFQLTGCEIFTSCEPCPMCMGAIYWARPDKVFFAATRHDAANAGFDDSMIYQELVCSVEDRKIDMINIGQQQALQVFKEWMDKPDKIAY